MPKNESQLRSWVERASLQSIDFVDIEMHRRHAEQLGGVLSYPKEPLTAQVSIENLNSEELKKDTFSCLCSAQVKWVETGKPKEEWALARVVIRLAYGFSEGEALKPEVVKDFSNQVGMHHAWTYARERLQLLAMWLGLPPFLLPLKPFRGLGGTEE